MFPECIRNTELTRGIAESFFSGRINDQSSFEGDKSFVSTLRALVYPRMNDGDVLDFSVRRCTYGRSELDRHPINAILDAMGVSETMSNAVKIVSLDSEEEDRKAMFDSIEQRGIGEGWHRLEKFTDFYRKSFYSDCYINPDRKSVAIFVERLNIRKYHYLQCSIFAFLPWYFNPKDGVSREEMDVINSLREKTKDKYVECVRKISERYNFRDMHIKKCLKGFETKFEEVKIRSLKERIDEIERLIRDYEDRICGYMRDKRDLDTQLFGFEIKKEEQSESEIMDYFLCNKKLTLDTVDDKRMYFVVCDTISYFDEDMAKTVIDNKRSYIYRCQRGNISGDDMKKLMEAIFIDQKIKLNMCAAYTFEIGSRVRGCSRFDYGEELLSVAMPNQHIDRYSCLGNYDREINSRIMENDYIGAIELCVASCKSLNFGDSTVMENFMEDMYRNKEGKVIVLSDGKRVTIPEAIEWLKQEESKSEEDKKEEGKDE